MKKAQKKFDIGWQYPPGYAVTFKVQHPTLRMNALSKLLRMRPTGGWTVGEPRRTPTGTALGGVNRNTYWYSALRPAPGVAPADFLRKHSMKLSRSRRFLSRIARTGGRACYRIALFGNGGDDLDPDLLRALSQLHLGLEVEVIIGFPEAERWVEKVRKGLRKR